MPFWCLGADGFFRGVGTGTYRVGIVMVRVVFFFFKLKAVVEEVFFSFFLSLFAWVEVLFLFSLS